MSDYSDMRVEELEQHHDRTRRKAKRRPHWDKAANDIAETLIAKKRERIAELESHVEDDELSHASRAAIRGLDENPNEREELREELDEQRSDVAELVRTVPDDMEVEEL